MKLNLGCGNKKKAGFIGVDFFNCEAVDVVADLTNKLPFEDSSIDEVWMDNFIEHIQDIPRLMKEIQRICKKGALVTIFTPHFASADSWRDPTHVHHLSYFSMDHFEKKGVQHYTGGGFKVLERRISFGGVLGNIGRLLCKVNPRKYESTWCFIFRPGTLKFIMVVDK
jgi:ubiquinone/menaquinone biosynthesis C-methylase UbiE